MKQTRLVHTVAKDQIPGLSEIVRLEGKYATINKVITDLLGPAIRNRLEVLRDLGKRDTRSQYWEGQPRQPEPMASNPFPEEAAK